jgi:hypothetical protein
MQIEEMSPLQLLNTYWDLVINLNNGPNLPDYSDLLGYVEVLLDELGLISPARRQAMLRLFPLR